MEICTILVTIFFIIVGYISTLNVQNRIIRGKPASMENFPYIVSIQTSNYHFCGGSIINANTILTAGHCISGINKDRISIRAGNSNRYKGPKYWARQLIVHPKYKETTYTTIYDLGIIKLKKSLKFNRRIKPIPLVEAKTVIPPYTIAYASGWGGLYENDNFGSDILRSAEVLIMPNSICNEILEPELEGDKITDQMLCAGETDTSTCRGDSGGPLVANGKLIGVTSWGESTCDTGYPGVYANISALRNFIDKYL